MVRFIPYGLINPSSVTPYLKLEKPVKPSLHTESEINGRHFIGGSDAHVIMGRAPDARPAPTFSSVEDAHTGLIQRLAVLKPYRILYIADAQDLEERAEHLQQVLGAVLDYVGAIVGDTSHVAPGGSIDRKYLLGLISDLAGDVAGSIVNAADDLAAGRV
jgi:hypothetical protein